MGLGNVVDGYLRKLAGLGCALAIQVPIIMAGKALSAHDVPFFWLLLLGAAGYGAGDWLFGWIAKRR